VLPDHDIARIADVMPPQLLGADLDLDRLDVLAFYGLARFHINDCLHRRMAGGVARITLHGDALRQPGLAQAARKLGDIPFVAEHFEKTAIALKHSLRPREAVRSQVRSQHATLGGTPEMQALDHCASARTRELDESARQRAGDPERMSHA